MGDRRRRPRSSYDVIERAARRFLADHGWPERWRGSDGRDATLTYLEAFAGRVWRLAARHPRRAAPGSSGKDGGR